MRLLHIVLSLLGVNAIKAGKYTQEGLKTEGEEEGLKTEGEEEGGQAEEGDTGPETKGNRWESEYRCHILQTFVN